MLTEATLQTAFALHRQGRVAEAQALYEDVLRAAPGNFEALHHLGLILCEQQQFLRALRYFDRALKAQPGNADGHNNRGNALRELRRLDEALASFDRAIKLQPDLAVSHCNRGNALRDLQRFDEAIASYDRAIELQGDLAQAWSNRAAVLRDLEHLDDAITSYDKALALNPNARLLFGDLLFTRLQACDWQDHAQGIEGLADRIARRAEAATPFVALATLDAPALHRQVGEHHAQSIARLVEPAAPPKRSAKRDKIHVGYYSANFHNHPVAYLTAELFEAHDKARFETSAFSFGPPRQDAMRQRLSKAFTRFVDVRQKSDAEIVGLSRDLRVDIAVDLMGHTQHGRPALFAGRAAPLQVNWLGYPGTTGAPFIDYIVADRIVIPDGAEPHYAEKVVRLPGCYQVNDSRRPVSDRSFTREECGLGERGFVFCSFNSTYKIQPATFTSWMRILRAVPESRLWLFESHATAARNLRTEAAARGVDGERLVFAPPLPLADHLARHRCADLFLDTLPYNAHTTASDALWMGLPVLTRIGQAFAGRVSASLLGALDLPDLVTATEQDFEARAIELATNPDKLGEIRERLARNRLSSDLFKGARFARHIEAAYAAIHERHHKGLPPEHITVGAGS